MESGEGGGGKCPARAAVVSLGCPKNTVDSEVMIEALRQAGFLLTPDLAEAELIVVNTCAFIEQARQESVETILELAEHKKAGSCKNLMVVGCLGERYKNRLMEEIPEIDGVLGTNEYPRIADYARQVMDGLRVACAGNPAISPDEAGARFLSTGHYAYVKIAEGCDHSCTFCTIPSIRGRYRSRPILSIAREVETLSLQGVKEFILVAQDTTAYGRDLHGRPTLAELLRSLGNLGDRRSGRWLRILYCHPSAVTRELLDAVREVPGVCRYLDLPLQHASRRILGAMGRVGDKGSYVDLVVRVREAVPGVAVRSSFIVGFPGETEDEFGELLSFMEDVRFDHVGVFTFSREEDTPSFAMEGQVPARVKNRRRAQAMKLQRRISLGKNRGLVGRCADMIIDRLHEDLREGPVEGAIATGRLETQAPEIDGVTFLRRGIAAGGDHDRPNQPGQPDQLGRIDQPGRADPAEHAQPGKFALSSLVPGQMVRCRVVKALPYDLVAEPWDSGADS